MTTQHLLRSASWILSALGTMALVASCEGIAEDQQSAEDQSPTFRAGMVNNFDAGRVIVADFDNDGVLDVVRSEPTWADGCSNVGRVLVWNNVDDDWFTGTPQTIDGSNPDLILHRDVTGIEGSNDCGDYFGATIAAGDFNGDGYDDLAIGVPGDDEGATNAGSIHIIFGSNTGLTTTGDQIYHQNTSGVPDSAESNDHWGEQLAVGDFNGDGIADLAVGAPQEDVTTKINAGSVTVLYGDSTGVFVGSIILTQDSSNVPDTAESGDECGGALMAGDFDGNGYDDLAWGCPGEDIGSATNAGGIEIVYGSAIGLTTFGAVFVHQDWGDIDDVAESNDEFGWLISTTDDNANGYHDLITIVEDNCGSGDINFHVVYGGRFGITDDGDSAPTGRKCARVKVPATCRGSGTASCWAINAGGLERMIRLAGATSPVDRSP